MKIKKFGRRTAGLMAGLMVVSVLAGCKGSDDKGKTSTGGAVIYDSYKFEETTLRDDMGEEDNISQMKYGNGAVYYMYSKMPDYPQEYYDDLDKINDDASVDAGEGDVSDDTAADSSDTAVKKDKESDTSDAQKKDADDVSDDELLGDIDDLFGDDSGKDNADKGSKDDTGNKDDNGGSDVSGADNSGSDNKDTMTYEEFEKKYADYKIITSFCKYDIESKKTTDLCTFEQDNVSVNDYGINKDGSIVILLNDYNYDEKSDTSTNKYILESYSPDGEKKDSIDITDKLGLKEEEGEYINNFKIVGDGAYLIGAGEGLFKVVTDKGEVKSEIKSEDYIDSIAVTTDGRVIACGYGKDGTYYAEIDVKNAKMGSKIEGLSGEEGTSTSYTLMDGAASFPLLLKDSKSYYTYDFEADKITKILDWMDAGIPGDSVNMVVPLDDGRIFCAYDKFDSKSAATIAGFLVEGDGKDSEKQVIKVMATYSSSDLQQRIIEYNKQSDKYKVEYITFDNDDNPTTKINNEITSGNIPDILDVQSVDYKNYAAKGILEDINTFVKNDDTMNESYFVDGLLDAIREDGKLYFIPDYFSIVSLAGKESELKQFKDGWTMKDVIKYYNSKPEGTSLLTGDSKSGVLNNFVLHDISNYIDWTTGEVKFDGKDFKDALEFCNKFPNDEDVNYDNIDTKNGYKNGKILLNSIYLSSYEELQVNKSLYKNDFMFVGYPCEKGFGTYILPNNALGICSGSKNKEAAWDVLKYLMSPEDNVTNYMSSFPASSSQFEDMVKKNTATEAYTDDNGNKVEPNNTEYTIGSETEEYTVKITPATEDEIQTIRDMIKRANGIYSYNSSAMEMLMDDVTSYFSGKKSLDETVKVIQDKMSKYVNENK